MNNNAEKFEVIKHLNLGSINKPSEIPKSLLIGCEKNLSIYYAPFDFVNDKAKVVIVGITPGFTQLKNAYAALQNSLRSGKTIDESLVKVKSDASFSGSMRSNLIEMLDYVGIHKWLGIPSAEQLFSARSDFLHSTSCLKHPVFVDGANYNGTPNMLKNDFLRHHLYANFAQEAQCLKKAIFIPLGPKPSEALEYLAKNGVIEKERILNGFLHPSAASQERINYFLDKKPKHLLSSKTNAAQIDLAKASIIKKVIDL